VPEAVEPITQLLAAWRQGDRNALERLAPLVQQGLLDIARAYLRRERADHTLQPTALVNEAYLRLLPQDGACHDRVHFYAVAAQVMRHVLIDYARERQRLKRRGAAVHITLNEELILAADRLEEVLAIDEALQRLAAIDERKCRVVELRFFAGLDVEETAEVLRIAPNTVIRDWNFARAWIRKQLTAGARA
jgi:RNA polymerase sigma factor (TIGR02999 family)